MSVQDPNLPDTYASLGLIYANYLWDWPQAERHFQRALELNPGCSPARQRYAEFLAEMGRIDEALLIIERARERSIVLGTLLRPCSRAHIAERAERETTRSQPRRNQPDRLGGVAPIGVRVRMMAVVDHDDVPG